MNLRKDHYRKTLARSLARLADAAAAVQTSQSRNRTAAVQQASGLERIGRRSTEGRPRRRGGIFGGRLPVSRRSGYLSRSPLPPPRSGGCGDDDGESIGGRRSSSGIRCPAASYAVVSARFKEPREPFVSSADERRPPRVVFSQTLRLFEGGDTERGERCQSGRCRCGGSVDRLRRRGRT